MSLIEWWQKKIKRGIINKFMNLCTNSMEILLLNFRILLLGQFINFILNIFTSFCGDIADFFTGILNARPQFLQTKRNHWARITIIYGLFNLCEQTLAYKSQLTSRFSCVKILLTVSEIWSPTFLSLSFTASRSTDGVVVVSASRTTRPAMLN